MGQWTSFCLKCNRKIYWFLQAPTDFVCKCGHSMTETEIENSWHDYNIRHSKERKNLDLIIHITRMDAVGLDLLRCECGHKNIDHHADYKACMKCDCKEYRETVRRGKIIKDITYFPKNKD